MINHFRTLALNVSAYGLTSPYTARNIHIDPSYTPLALPADLSRLYAVFYPTSNLTAKLELTKAYLSMLEGCGLTEALTALDPRMTYEIVRPESPEYLRRISVGVPTTSAAEDPSIAVRIFNYNYVPSFLHTPLVRTLSIEQQTNTNNIQVLEGVTLLHSATLTFDSGYSQLVSVPDPDNNRVNLFDFQVKHPTSPGFTATSGKKWEVTFSVTYTDIIRRQLEEVKKNTALIGQITNTYKLAAASPYDELWLRHFNDVYRMAGLYVSLVYRMNALYLSQKSATPPPFGV